MINHFATAVFDNPEEAKNAVKRLVEAGFGKGEISVVGRANKDKVDDNILRKVESDTIFWGIQGGIWGGVLGLLLGGVLFVVPGIGPIVGAGPIAGALSGLVGGAVSGATAVALIDGLIEFGLSREKAEHYKKLIEEGKVLVMVKGDLQKVEDAADILQEHAIEKVEVK